MNRQWVQDLLVVAVFLAILLTQSFFHDDEPDVKVIIEQSKKCSLSDASKNELMLYRQGKYLTGFGDSR